MSARSILTTGAWVAAVQQVLQQHANVQNAAAMRAYLRDQFDFYGVKTPLRRKLVKPLLQGAKHSFNEVGLLEAAQALYAFPQRELHYVAVDTLAAAVGQLSGNALPQLEALVIQHSWWDTVDGLAVWVVGPLVLANRSLHHRIDVLSQHENKWLRRVAILHQLKWKQQTDIRRLFAYCHINADKTDFFIRKAIGWALREYAYTDPDAVRDFVEYTPLSPLSVREAMKHLTKE
ncbi:DNA alkylation repair protein [Chitinivorax sp. B]|uniref:DNA alkylation repair protein n=1 Tax=Chitinivorax sp. B TaxID=2502235 RepID=UPI0020181EF2|nr:DNA alkylation repair protein [Chitinivorax sp. B]